MESNVILVLNTTAHGIFVPSEPLKSVFCNWPWTRENSTGHYELIRPGLIQWLIKIRKGTTTESWLSLRSRPETDERQTNPGRELPGPWDREELGSCRKTCRSHPRMLFRDAQHLQTEPVGCPSPGGLLELSDPGPWPGPALLTSLLHSTEPGAWVTIQPVGYSGPLTLSNDH